MFFVHRDFLSKIQEEIVSILFPIFYYFLIVCFGERGREIAVTVWNI